MWTEERNSYNYSLTQFHVKQENRYELHEDLKDVSTKLYLKRTLLITEQETRSDTLLK